MGGGPENGQEKRGKGMGLEETSKNETRSGRHHEMGIRVEDQSTRGRGNDGEVEWLKEEGPQKEVNRRCHPGVS